MYTEEVMEIGIGRYIDGCCFFVSSHNAFKEKYGDRLDDIYPAQVFPTMDKLATWVNNDIGIGCFFYMF